MMLRAKNDDKRIINEVKQLRTRNRPLLKLLVDLYKYIKKSMDKDTIITMIYRTQDEQDRIYGNRPRYEENPWKSPHQFWHAIDLRSKVYTIEELDEIVDYLNNKYNTNNYYKFTAMYHKVSGGAYHLHIQYYSVTS
jgi:hypothetical protein